MPSSSSPKVSIKVEPISPAPIHSSTTTKPIGSPNIKPEPIDFNDESEKPGGRMFKIRALVKYFNELSKLPAPERRAIVEDLRRRVEEDEDEDEMDVKMEGERKKEKTYVEQGVKKDVKQGAKRTREQECTCGAMKRARKE